MTQDGKKNCIINVAGRSPYTAYQQRLINRCEEYNTQLLRWTDKYPAKSRTHHESLYGFKVHAFNYAFKLGFENVLWLDSPCYLVADPAPIFDFIEKDGTYLIGTDTPLWKHCNDKTLEAFSSQRSDIKGNENIKLLSGSFIGMHRREQKLLLDEWGAFEDRGYFLSAEEDSKQVKEFEGDGGHRHDESVLSMLALVGGYTIVPVHESHFQNGDQSLVKSEKW